MRKFAHELIFISQINRDGSGTTPVSKSYLDCMLNNSCCVNDKFKIRRLSITEDTYLAMGFNTFVVKLKV